MASVGTACMIAALRIVAELAERPELAERAQQAARTLWGSVAEQPRFSGAALADLLISDEARRGLKPAVAVVVSDDPFSELARASWRLAPAGSYVVTAPEGAAGWGSHLEQRPAGFVYVCRGTVCFDPVDDYNNLKTPLWSRV